MRANKYNARKTTIDNITFHSKAEAERYSGLKLMAINGDITDLELQPKFTLLEPFTDSLGNRHRGIKYVADFQYTEDGRAVVEDVKGVETQAFKIKAKLFRYHYPEFELRLVK